MSEFVKVTVVGPYVPGARLSAVALTVKVTTVPGEDTLPEIEEGLSQLGTPDIE